MNTELSRRGFILQATALVGGLSISHYLEPFLAVPDKYKDWIEDRGDFFVVRVPDGKRLEGQTFDKPTILLLGALACFKSNTVKGYLNVYAPKQGAILNSFVDARACRTDRERPAIMLKGSRLLFSRNTIDSSAGTHTTGMQLLDGSGA